MTPPAKTNGVIAALIMARQVGALMLSPRRRDLVLHTVAGIAGGGEPGTRTPSKDL
jgi:hypothetical protein